MLRFVRAVAGLVMAALVAASLTACSSSPAATQTNSGGPSAPPAPAPPPAATVAAPEATETSPPYGETAWQQELANVDDGGRRSLESALRLFAIAFGPLPGVDAPDDGRAAEDGTLAYRAVLAHWDELSPEQQAAVEAAVAPPPGAFHFTVAPASAGTAGPIAAIPGSVAALAGSGFFAAVPSPEVQERLVKAAHDIRAFYADKLGGDMPGMLEVYLSGETPPRKNNTLELGMATPIYNDQDVFTGCTLVVNGNATNRGDPAALRVMAHEIFHCFQASIIPRADWAPMPDWVAEGSADWAADQIHPYPPKNALWWREYLTAPLTSLFTRTYAAIGFYGHLAETGVDPWAVFRPMWTSGLDNMTIFGKSGADNPDFMNSWASGLLREPARGRAWNTDEVSITFDKVLVVNGDETLDPGERWQYKATGNALTLVAGGGAYVVNRCQTGDNL